MPTNRVLIDDRLLVAHLLGAKVLGRREGQVHTTSCWYYRACRAAVVGAGGQLSGPFARLDDENQARAVRAMLVLPDEIALPDPRALVPVMAEVAARHPRLNLLNVEATAAARLLDARVLLSGPAGGGVLPGALDGEHISWTVRAVPTV